MKIETEIMFNVHAQCWQWYVCLMEKCYEYEMFLIELGKFWHKFQIYWISRTQVMDEIVGNTQLWTVHENAKNSCSRWVKWKSDTNEIIVDY